MLHVNYSAPWKRIHDSSCMDAAAENSPIPQPLPKMPDEPMEEADCLSESEIVECHSLLRDYLDANLMFSSDLWPSTEATTANPPLGALSEAGTLIAVSQSPLQKKKMQSDIDEDEDEVDEARIIASAVDVVAYPQDDKHIAGWRLHYTAPSSRSTLATDWKKLFQDENVTVVEEEDGQGGFFATTLMDGVTEGRKDKKREKKRRERENKRRRLSAAADMTTDAA